MRCKLILHQSNLRKHGKTVKVEESVKREKERVSFSSRVDDAMRRPRNQGQSSH